MPQKMEVVLFVWVSNFILKPCWFLTNQFSHFLFFSPAVRFHWHACPSCLRNLPSPAIYLNVSFRWNFYDVLKGTTVAKSNQENLHLLGVKFNSESLPTLFFMMKHFGYYYVFLQYKHANFCRSDVMRALHQYPTLRADLQNFSKWAFQFWKQFLTVGDRCFETNFLCMCNDELFLNIFGFNKVKKQVSSLLIKLTIGSYISGRSSRYEACGKFGEHERCVRDALGIAESNSSFLSALQTSCVLHISMNAQLMYEPIVL